MADTSTRGMSRARKHYASPTLAKRADLAKITAITATSGIVTDF
jgi:hypothetical protein